MTRVPGPGGGWTLFRLRSAGPNRAWAMGSQFINGGEGNWTAWCWDGAWTAIPTPAMGFPTATATDAQGGLWIADADGVWRYDGARWVHHAPGRKQLGSICAGAADDVWVSGLGLAHWDGSAWRDFGTLTLAAFGRVAPDDIWAVGTPQPNGIGFDLWHWDGKSWTPEHETFLPLSMAALPNGEIWGAGGGSLLHRRAP